MSPILIFPHHAEEKLVSAIDDLTAAVTQLTTDVQALIAAFQSSNDTSAIEAQTAALTTLDQEVVTANPPPAPPAG
jgi:outer membrane murein-binding lipoprotein Lpp